MMSISPDYRKAMGIAVAIQVIVVLCSGLILDFGQIGQICLMALPAFWGGVAVLIWRRPRQPTRTDLALIRIGYLPTVVLTGWLAGMIWRFRGVW